MIVNDPMLGVAEASRLALKAVGDALRPLDSVRSSLCDSCGEGRFRSPLRSLTPMLVFASKNTHYAEHQLTTFTALAT